jgi:mannose-1-phosphate guanylyltransferase
MSMSLSAADVAQVCERLYVAILAGGSGTRLWPLSRARRPKQLLRLAGERTLVQETFERVAALVPATRVLVLTEQSHAAAVRDQLPAVPAENVLVEPVRRGTAGALALAAFLVRQRDPQAVMACLSSDHLIPDAAEFRRTLAVAAAAAADGRYLLTLGIQPTSPSTQFGYIEVADELARVDDYPVYRVARFVEKPERAVAETYVQSGRHLWNSGIFVWRVDTILAQFHELMPHLYATLEPLAPLLGTAAAAEALARVYPTIEVQTVDYGILERAPNVAVVPARFAWSDLGNWAELYAILPRDPSGNVVQGRHLVLDTHGSLVVSEVSGRTVVLLGVQDLVVVDTPDVLLICPRSRAAEVKRLVEWLEGDPRFAHLL